MEMMMYAYSSNTYLSRSFRSDIKTWIKNRIYRMELKYPIVSSVIMKMLDYRDPIPSLDRRGLNSLPDLKLNIDLYATFGLVLPFRDKKLMHVYKNALLDSNKPFSKKYRKVGVEYINTLEKISWLNG